MLPDRLAGYKDNIMSSQSKPTLSQVVGQRLRAARQSAGFKTARAFAQTHDIAQSTYSQYETGKRHFSINILVKFSEFLNINPNWLLFGKLPMFNPADDKSRSAPETTSSAVKEEA